MLEVRGLSVSYGQHRALEEVAIRVDKGEIVVILGANGAGKSTLLSAIAGTCAGTVHGEVRVDGVTVTGEPSHRIVEEGVALVPEGRGVFGELTVRENLLLGAYAERAREGREVSLDRVLGLFPKLRERQRQTVRTMSGGEQQMVAIGRAMMSSPSVLMLDEPSLGLSPLLCKELFRSLAEVRGGGLGILLVEQNAKQSLAIADRGYLLENSRITGADSAANLRNDPAVQAAYLGAGGKLSRASRHEQAATATRPAPFTPATGMPLRQHSNDLIAVDVAALVDRASTIQAQHVAARRETRPGMPTAAAGPGAGLSLDDALADIERAAADARRPRTAAAVETAVKPAVAEERFDDLPEIEVYRRPRVAVYRRQSRTPGKRGKLVRVDGE